MPRHARHDWWVPGLLALGLLGACSTDDVNPAPTSTVADAMTIASDAARASGATSLGAVGGDGQQEHSASLSTLPWGGTVGAFIACTGGGSIGLDLAGTQRVLDCDGQAHPIGDLVLPDDQMSIFKPTQVSETPSSWGVAFVEAQRGPAAPEPGTTRAAP